MQEPIEEQSVQILNVKEDNDSFSLNSVLLESILSRVDGNIPIAVLSVVGAFRSGKSLLLDFFLRFLRYYELNPEVVTRTKQSEIPKWIFGEGDYLEGDSNNSESKRKGFSWRCGKDRETLGIWIWNKPFILRNPRDPTHTIAVLIMDTQGMFDGQTTQMLTTCIFGLTTLLSSFQIYNVDKRLQEDILQHLALFSEYGRIVLDNDSSALSAIKQRQNVTASYMHLTRQDQDNNKNDASLSSTDSHVTLGNPEDDAENTENTNITPLENNKTTFINEKDEEEQEVIKQFLKENNVEIPAFRAPEKRHLKPFQHIDFVVRDWQNYTCEEDAAMCIAESHQIVDKFFEMREGEDLQSTREHIQSCFSIISGMLLPHPGLSVTKKNFCGELKLFEKSFLLLVGHYIETVFLEQIQPKTINGFPLLVKNFLPLTIAYAQSFIDGYSFPQASTILAATATLNNQQAKEEACDLYLKEMTSVVNDEKGYLTDEALLKQHTIAVNKAIQETYDDLNICLINEFTRLKKENKLRDPLAFVEPYLIPLFIMTICFAIKFILSYTCFSFSRTCRTSYNYFDFLTTCCIIYILFTTYKSMRPIYYRIIQAIKNLIFEKPKSE
ncbi:hypothetical protein WA158_001707 [Blastocystis sp. Blastoise]